MTYSSKTSIKIALNRVNILMKHLQGMHVNDSIRQHDMYVNWKYDILPGLDACYHFKKILLFKYVPMSPLYKSSKPLSTLCLWHNILTYICISLVSFQRLCILWRRKKQGTSYTWFPAENMIWFFFTFFTLAKKSVWITPLKSPGLRITLLADRKNL